MLLALLTGGHVLPEGLPGLAKTLLVRSLADEVNRAPPKVQAALLEAMEEEQVTIAAYNRCQSPPGRAATSCDRGR